MNKQTKGILLALGGAVALFWWYRRRQTPEAKSDSALANIGQLGGDFQQDVTPEIVKATLDYAQRQSAGCWRRTGADNGWETWVNTMTGQSDILHATEPKPANACRTMLP